MKIHPNGTGKISIGTTLIGSDPPPKPMTGSESLYGFCGWLTTRNIPITMSAKHTTCGEVAELIDKFCKTNDLDDPRDGWDKNLTHPKENDAKNNK